MIINFKKAVIRRLHNLYIIDQQKRLTRKEMDEYFFLIQNYSHFLKENENEQ